MSNHLAIATVSGVLHTQLLNATALVPGATVTTTRPNGAAANPPPAINIFLYQVTPNAAYRNADLPTRRGDGQLVCRPQVALTLHYLLSFTGDEATLEPQRLLGAAVRQLHAHPLVTGQDIVQTITNPPYDTVLPTSNLAEQVDVVRFTPLGYSLEELSKLWSIFFQSPYLLSVAYQASAVLIETDDTPRPALPVQTRNLYVLPFRYPAIDRVIAATGANLPIIATSTLAIEGRQLNGEVTRVVIGGVEFTPAEVTPARITMPVPPMLRPGVHALQVMQPILMGSPAVPHRGFESNVATFVLRPQIAAPVVQTTVPNPQGGAPLPALQVTVDLTIGRNQRVVLVLNGVGGANPAAHSFLAPPRNADSTTVTVAIPNVAAGQYFVRLQVDGAESLLDLDTASPSFGPTVVVP
jgi:hypothetical protein